MNFCIVGANVFTDGAFQKRNLRIKDGNIAEIFSGAPSEKGILIYYVNNCFVFPGLIDVHVHLREPGFFYKESIKTGTLAAAHGGFTSICAMPNLNPVPDSLANLNLQQQIIKTDAQVRVYPYASITVGESGDELSAMDALAPFVAAFSDDGVGVETADLMRNAMQKAATLNKIIVAHCEDTTYGTTPESEWKQLERDLKLVEETACNYHVCHISTKESVDLIRKAKARGLPVTCETAPHYLTLCDENLQDSGNYKMNPPIRTAADRAALLAGIKDGTIDIIATDHAPHSAEEKSGGFKASVNGIVGLETAFPILYTKLVKTGIIPLEKLITLMQVNPATRFGIGTEIKVGATADLTIFDLEHEYTIAPETFYSKGRATPFANERVHGKCLLTLVGGVPKFADRSFCFNEGGASNV